MTETIIINVVVALGVILVSMTLHEVMHGIVAYWLGDDTAKLQGRLTLNPIQHIDPFMTVFLPLFLVVTSTLTGGMTPIFGGAKPVPFNPDRVRYDEWGAALVAIAGPLTNLFLAFVSFGIWVLCGTPSMDNLLGKVLFTSVSVNLGFFVFNMIPIPPLDGSRVLYALAPEFVRRGMEAIEQYGIFFVFALVLVASSYIGAFMTTIIQFFIVLFGQLFGLV